MTEYDGISKNATAYAVGMDDFSDFKPDRLGELLLVIVITCWKKDPGISDNV